MANRFEFEDNLMKCWNVTSDLELLESMVGDIEMDAKDQDRLMNIIIGMKELYNVRFSTTFDIFEKLIHTEI